MMETVRIRRSGYPVRRAYEDFIFRYSVLGRVAGVSKFPEPKAKCVAIMQRYQDPNSNKDWQPGHSKVTHHNYCCFLFHFYFMHFTNLKKIVIFFPFLSSFLLYFFSSYLTFFVSLCLCLFLFFFRFPSFFLSFSLYLIFPFMYYLFNIHLIILCVSVLFGCFFN